MGNSKINIKQLLINDFIELNIYTLKENTPVYIWVVFHTYKSWKRFSYCPSFLSLGPYEFRKYCDPTVNEFPSEDCSRLLDSNGNETVRSTADFLFASAATSVCRSRTMTPGLGRIHLLDPRLLGKLEGRICRPSLKEDSKCLVTQSVFKCSLRVADVSCFGQSYDVVIRVMHLYVDTVF